LEPVALLTVFSLFAPKFQMSPNQTKRCRSRESWSNFRLNSIAGG
jgi:hypothetical protein